MERKEREFTNNFSRLREPILVQDLERGTVGLTRTATFSQYLEKSFGDTKLLTFYLTQRQDLVTVWSVIHELLFRTEDWYKHDLKHNFSRLCTMAAGTEACYIYVIAPVLKYINVVLTLVYLTRGVRCLPWHIRISRASQFVALNLPLIGPRVLVAATPFCCVGGLIFISLENGK